MKLLIALYFFVLATIQFGLLIGIYYYYRSKSLVKPSPYWLGSLLFSVAGLIIFGGGIFFVSDIARPDFNFTVANAFFYVAALLQFLFCRSLNAVISREIRLLSALSIIVFMIVFEWLRLYSNFEVRTIFMCFLATFFYGSQILQLQTTRKATPSHQLLYLQFATAGELIFAIGRLFILVLSALTIRNVDQIPQVLIFSTIAQLVMNTLSYIAIGGYWAEKVATANAQVQNENQAIKALLIERESLISNLLKANKTAATGALSASIAHELNQPLGASHLNIQYLQKKLADGNLSKEQNQEVLSALLSDNQRASSIIKSLRSIFFDGRIGAEKVNIGELIESVLTITKPEIQSKNIQVVLRLTSKSLVNAKRGELQQVILNLINNAIQALSDSSANPRTLKIESADVAEGIEIRFSDNGPGVSDDAIAHLFELFADSNKRTGMGLGLWLCQHVISRHGGRIRYKGASGGGAQFIVFLPKSPV